MNANSRRRSEMKQVDNNGITEAEAKKEIQVLSEKYQSLKASGRIKQFNEERTKKEFIEPLFEALGWDIRNKYHDDEVLVEEKVSRGRVDYSFRINGLPVFFVEAKALKENIDTAKFVEQAINYSWHKGCTWAILTDFERLRVYNAEWKNVNPLQSLFISFDSTTYLTNFERLWWLSKEGFLRDVLDKEAEELGKKSKKVPVDKQLLQDLTQFRELLTKDIVKNNSSKKLSVLDLDESVQRIIDRLIFIRVCEDRRLEQPFLQPLIREDTNKKIYKKLNELFRAFDDIYDSKLFSYHLCEDLVVTDEVLEKIIKGLFTTQDNLIHYDFGVIDADVIGNIYEQYLGHILKKTEKRAKIKSGKAHRKEYGIYYTPTYVVDYIAKSVIQEWVKPKGVDPDNIRVLDPACGSGSFLIKAFDYLLALSSVGELEQTKLDVTGISATYTKKLGILQNNIFGVDSDAKAVEIAQLNLLLKAAEKKQRLPMLQGNIKVGNSLIDDPAVAGDLAFRWDVEFKDILRERGFDVIIGNPPYVRPHKIPIPEKEYLWHNTETFRAKSDLYNCFIEKGIRLLKQGGLISFIVPHTWISLESFCLIRKFILDNCKVLKLVQLPKKVFQDATVETCIFIFQKEANQRRRTNNEIVVEQLDEQRKVTEIKRIKQRKLEKNYLYNFELYSDESSTDIITRINRLPKLREFVDFSYGLKTGDDEKFISKSIQDENSKPLVRSAHISRYRMKYSGEYIWYVPKIMTKNKKTARPGHPRRFEQPKIIVGRMGKNLFSTYDEEAYYIKDGMLLTAKNDSKLLLYLVGLINSKLLNFYYRNYFVTIDVLKNAILQLPIKIALEHQQNLIQLVHEMLSINNRLNEIGDKRTDETARIEEAARKTDGEINELVYSIYGITESEKGVIDESLKQTSTVT
jgi:type I restriction-modification system DNA methylase subunit